jgi:hypothetical protein
MREGTTSRVMAADRPYGEFYDFYSVSLEYFGYHHVFDLSGHITHRQELHLSTHVSVISNEEGLHPVRKE